MLLVLHMRNMSQTHRYRGELANWRQSQEYKSFTPDSPVFASQVLGLQVQFAIPGFVQCSGWHLGLPPTELYLQYWKEVTFICMVFP